MSISNCDQINDFLIKILEKAALVTIPCTPVRLGPHFSWRWWRCLRQSHRTSRGHRCRWSKPSWLRLSWFRFLGLDYIFSSKAMCATIWRSWIDTDLCLLIWGAQPVIVSAQSNTLKITPIIKCQSKYINARFIQTFEQQADYGAFMTNSYLMSSNQFD